MQKRWIIPGLLAAAFAFAATGLASDGGKPPPNKFGPYDVVTDDHGSCGNVWAVDTMKRTFQVKRNQDGTYRLTRRDQGGFRTNRGRSPGACQPRRPHGSFVSARKRGSFHGVLRGTITGGTFDQNATCPADCGFTDVWIATFFGPNATFSCFEDSRDCAFYFEYSARGQRLRRHLWQDVGRGAGTLLHERFYGDIATR